MLEGNSAGTSYVKVRRIFSMKGGIVRAPDTSIIDGLGGKSPSKRQLSAVTAIVIVRLLV